MASSVPTVDLPNGRKMPIIGIGTFTAKDDEGRMALNTALECGYRHIDTAAVYENESALGDVLQEWLSSGKITRDELFVTTKLPPKGNRASDVSKHLDSSLKKLQLPYVDLYLIHIPVGFKAGESNHDSYEVDSDGNIIFDFDTDLEALYKAMEEQVDRGKTKEIGLSNFNSKQIERIMKVCRIRPANLQVEIHAYHQQRELRAVCRKHGIPVCAFAPIGAPHQFNSCDGDLMPLENPTVIQLASRLNKTPAQILIRFLIQSGIIAIPKSSNPERIKQNVQVFDFNHLSPSDVALIEALDKGKRGKLFLYEDMLRGITAHPEYPFHIPF